jgi:hypothetical protein
LQEPSPPEQEEALIGEFLPLRGNNYIKTILANNAHLILFCSDSEQRTDRSRWLTRSQAAMGAGQHQCWAASGKQLPASGGKWLAAGGQQGGDIACLLIGHGRCCFVVLLSWQPLTDGNCDDVLDVVEDISGETVIKLMQEEKRIIERYGSDKKMYT